MSAVTFTFIDSSGETSTMTMNLPAIAVDGSNWAAVQLDINDLYAALDAVTLGAIKEYKFTASHTRLGNAIPTTGEREEKVLVRYQDDVSLKVYSVTIPCRDRDKFPWQPGTDLADINDSTIPEFTALIAALNTNMLSPEGNAITVISMEKVGRNL